MSTTIKYKLSEVSADLGMETKEISNIIELKFEKPKSVSAVLTVEQLNFVFDVLTQKNQTPKLDQFVKETILKNLMESMEKEALQQEKKKAEAQKASAEQVKKTAPQHAAAKPLNEQVHKAPAAGQKPQQFAPRPQQSQNTDQRPQQTQNAGQKQQQTNRPTSAGQARQARPQSGAASQPSLNIAPKMPSDVKPFERQQKEKRGPQVKASDITKRVVDTRLTEVNLAKYDEKLEQFLPVTAKQDNKVVTKSRIRRGPVSLKTKGKGRNDAEFLKKIEAMNKKKSQLIIKIPEEISVGDLAAMLKVQSTQVIKKLMALGVMASVSELIDFDTAGLIAIEFGAKVEHLVTVTIEEQLIDESTDNEEDLVSRSPVVVVMGHVDHGKTSLLDAIRHENVVAGEAGGITQHIGAYKIKVKEREITFLDTPGHEAFTAMRARGAQVTDIAILVVAADDGIMPQTVEAINHAKQAGVSIIVAVNKMDKPEANIEKIKQELTEHGLVAEEWGGDTIICPVSAVKKTGIDNLLEMIILTADMRELKANPNRFAKGTVIEASLDKGRGPVATLLVQNGTLKTGNVIIAGTCVGRVRLMTDDKGNKIEEAGPSTPVEIMGLSEVPNAGDIFHSVEDEKMARELADQRKSAIKNEEFSKHKTVTLDDLFSQIKAGEIKDLNIIVKADVQGSSEALRASLEKLSNDEVRVRVIHSGVGAITKGDVAFASASNAIIVGFNVRPDSTIRSSAEEMGVDIRLYRIIYEAIEEMEQAMKGLLAPIYKENTLGHAEVRQTFKVPGVGVVSGCYVQEGKIARNAQVRLVRDGIVIHEGKIDSLKRFKDDAKEVAAGYECGIGLERYNDVKEGDIIEAFIMEQIAR